MPGRKFLVAPESLLLYEHMCLVISGLRKVKQSSPSQAAGTPCLRNLLRVFHKASEHHEAHGLVNCCVLGTWNNAWPFVAFSKRLCSESQTVQVIIFFLTSSTQSTISLSYLQFYFCRAAERFIVQSKFQRADKSLRLPASQGLIY